MRKTLISLLLLLALAVPAIAEKHKSTADPVAKASETEDLRIENLQLKLVIYSIHKADLQREENAVGQTAAKLAEAVASAHPGYHLDFKTLSIVVNSAETESTAAPAAPATSEAPKK